MKLFQPSAQASHQLAKFRWWNVQSIECGSPQGAWDTVSQRAHYVNLSIPGTTREAGHKIYSYEIYMHFIGLATQYFTGVVYKIHIQKIMDSEATGMPVNTKHYVYRSTSRETQRLSAASSVITR
jgi:hypothetical protein